MFDTEVWITVLEYLRGYPVAGADVTLFDTGSFLETTGKTDGNGIFKTFVRTSRYILTVSASGYRDWVLEVGIGGTLFEQLAVLITDSPEPPIDPPVVVDVAIHVNDPSGNPVVGASVSLGEWSRTTNWAGIAYFAEIGISLYDYVVVAEGFHDASMYFTCTVNVYSKIGSGGGSSTWVGVKYKSFMLLTSITPDASWNPSATTT